MKGHSTWSIGNDIVDLSYPGNQSKYLDRRFCQRVFTQNENNTIELSLEKDKVLWALWAAKEAAFKACQKRLPEIIFSHKKFSVNSETLNNLSVHNFHKKLTGILNYHPYQIALEWRFTESYVHCTSVFCLQNKIFQAWQTLAVEIKSKQLNSEISALRIFFSQEELASIYSEESLLTRYYAKQLLYSLGCHSSLEIIRPRLIESHSSRLGPPVLSLQGKVPSDWEVSLSHDEGWMGIVTNVPHHLC